MLVLCWSHKQRAWDQHGVFQIYGINNQPWLTISMVEEASKEEITEVVRWVGASHWQAKCPNLWTPLTDQRQEGVFKSLVSGKFHDNLAWSPG